MKLRSFKTILLAATVAAVAARAQAEVLVVSPENMQGWVIATHSGAKLSLPSR